MDLSIVLLNYKTCNLLKNCIRSIKESVNNTTRYEIIVVDNASHDGTSEMLTHSFPEIKAFFLPVNAGHAAGNNVGISVAQGKYILILNTDTVFLEDHILDKMIEFMENNADAAAMGPQLVNPDGSVQATCRQFPNVLQPLYSRTVLGRTKKGKEFMKHFLLQDVDLTRPRTVDWLQSSCMVVRSDIIKRIGPMDELFFVYFSDVDWCRRFWLGGYKVYYNPEIKLFHYFHRESAEHRGIRAFTNPITRIHIKDWIRYILKYNTMFFKKTFTQKFNFTDENRLT